jgi:drug/metabolite transporter (DMT)-like permease
MLTILWGAAFPAIKVAVAEMPVLTFRAVCLIFGSAGAAVFALVRGRSLALPRDLWGWMVAWAVLNSLLWNLLTAYGLTLLPAGRAVIIGYTMPFWALLFSALFLREPVNLRKILGLLLGFGGLAVLIGPDLGALGRAPIGALSVRAAAMSWGLGTVLLKYKGHALPTSVLATWQLGLAAVPILIAALIFDDFYWQMSREAWLALGFVVIGAMVIAHLVWFSIVRLLPASVAAISTLAIPVVGIIVGALWLGERVGFSELAALGLVLLGLFVVLVLPALRFDARR